MKKTTKIIAGCLASVLALSGTVIFGSKAVKQAEIYYRNIKIKVNGEEIKPSNEQGETVEPFIYEGTTYLPMRAVADAVGMDVAWDEETGTVLLTDKNGDGEGVVFTFDKNAFHEEIEHKVSSIMPKEALDNEILVNVAGVPVSAASVRYAVRMSEQDHDFANDEETLALIEREIDDYYRFNGAVILTAEKMGLDISDSVFYSELADVYEQIMAQYGENTKEIIENFTHQTTYFYFLNQYYNLLYRELYNRMLEEPDFEKAVRESTLKVMESENTPYVRAKHILVAFEENATEEEKAKKKALADELYARAAKGEDFDKLIKEYGEDPGMVSYPGGYYFTYGEMVGPFEQASFGLKTGEISQPVETSFGYHIIQRLELDDDAIMSTEGYINTGYQLLRRQLEGVAANLTVEFAENYNERAKEFKLGNK